MTNHKPLRIALISPKGPLYRHRGGIFRKSLRYQPLTLTTLAALVPPELGAELTLIDEVHEKTRDKGCFNCRDDQRHDDVRTGSSKIDIGRPDGQNRADEKSGEHE